MAVGSYALTSISGVTMSKQSEEQSGHEQETLRPAGIQVIARAGEILRALGRNPEGLSLGEIAQEVNLPRSTVQRIINALADERLVEPVGPGGGVRLGPALGQLIHQSQTDIISLTKPYLQELSRSLRESVCLSRLSGDQVYVIDRIVAERELRVVFPIGISTPAHTASAGKILLAEMPDSSVARLLPQKLAALTSKTVDLEKLLAQLQECRQTGLSTDMDEAEEGVGSCSVALDTYLGLFSLSVVAPSARLGAAEMDKISLALLQCKHDIERAIGHNLCRENTRCQQ